MKRPRYMIGCMAFIGMCILILDTKTALSGARAGIDLCIHSLIPSIFPFLVLSNLLTTVFVGTALPFLRPIGRFFGIPQGCETVLIPSFLGGYPAGAQCIGQIYREGKLTKRSAQRLLLFCNNPGPSFLFGILGPIFSDPQAPWLLWSIQIISAIICSVFYTEETDKAITIPERSCSLTDSLASAIRIMGTICGWVIVFRVIIAFLDRWFLWKAPLAIQIMVKGLLELSNGCFALSGIADVRLRFLICSAILSFGGLCVTMQTASLIGDISIIPYAFGKLLQCLISICFSAGFVYRTPIPILTSILLFCLIKITVAFRRTMMYNKGIKLRRTQYVIS